tara:strand:- start:422 stop:793 length:372 start_codon:yes stop_codon:yes gene_type:complete
LLEVEKYRVAPSLYSPNPIPKTILENPGPLAFLQFPLDFLPFPPAYTDVIRIIIDNIYVITLDTNNNNNPLNLINTMRTIKNTWTKANNYERLQLVLFSTVMTLLTTVVVSWAASGFYTDFGI